MENTLICKICGFRGRSLITHLKFKHKMTVAVYRADWGGGKVLVHTDSSKKKLSDSLKQVYANSDLRLRLSALQRGGASHFTVKYWTEKRGFSVDDAKKKITEIQKKNSDKHLEKSDLRTCSRFCKEYWISRGCSEDDAREKIVKIQSKLSARSSKFKGHAHLDSEKSRISASMTTYINQIGRGRWAKHFGEFNGRSKAEIEFYNYIKANIDASVEANVPIGHYIVDVVKQNRIIEFYGDFWHANPMVFSKTDVLNDHRGGSRTPEGIWNRDAQREDWLRREGYTVLVIWELEWKQDREKCTKKIREFLS